jgi:hypothetical protein
MKNITYITFLFVVVSLISSSSLSGTLNNKVVTNEVNTEGEKEITKLKESLTGLDPALVENNLRASSPESPMTQPLDTLSDDGWFYACDVFNPYPVVRWDLETGEDKEELANGANAYFLSAGTWSCDEIWYGCEYNTGSLWMIDPDTGEMTQIGGGTRLNALAWDPVYNRLYGAKSHGLYEIDPETGEQEYIGSFGINYDIICLVIDMEGVCWGYDVKSSGNAILYNIDLETGEATEYCDMGRNLVYAQDGDIDRDTGILWMAAYSSYGFYAYWDWDSKEIVEITTLDSQYACAMIRSSCVPPEHDVGVKAILKPTESGHAVPNMDMELLVKNYGNNTETFDAQMEIYNQTNYNQSSSTLMWEDFSGSFPPEGWETDSFIQCNDSCSPDPPCACLYKYNQGENSSAYITSKPVDASEYKRLSLRFYFAANMGYPQYCNFYVKVRMNESSPWKDVTPWEKPLGEEMEGDLFEIDFYGFGDKLGEAFQIKWEFIGYYYYYNWFILDSINLEGTNDSIEYAELVEDITLAPLEEKIIVFPSWTPSLWQDPEYENTWVNYTVYAFTILEGDQKPSNDNKFKLKELYFGFLHDIEISSIDSPFEDGPGKTYPVIATIKNVGQYAECCIHIDINIYELVLEYSDSACQGDDLEPGESRTFEFEDWTPDYLQYETTGSKDYMVHAEIEIDGDKNPSNDNKSKYFTLDFWHDPALENVTSPLKVGRGLLWKNGDPDGHDVLQEWGGRYDLASQLTGYSSGPPGINAYIQPGTESIDAIAINQGTFQELDLVCTAEIWEFITDPDNGTQQYTDEITNIDLVEPLGGTFDLAFDDFSFAYEGRYGLYLTLFDNNEDDDFPNNNAIGWGIGVDDTKPVSSHSLDPPIPDGENGWYVNDLEVILQAMDPSSMDVSSGVDMIKYKINDGAEQTIDGDGIVFGNFLITQTDDKKDVKVEYWAIDNVGNVETSHTFYIDMDQTPPTVDLTYEVISGDPIQGWVFEFTVTAVDVTSGMDRVEFYLNDELVETIYGPGPTYQWEWNYCGNKYRVLGLIFNPQFSDDYIKFFALIVLVKSAGGYFDLYVIAYDKAGNYAKDSIEHPTNTSDIEPGIYMFQSLTFPNNYTGKIGNFFINAVFNYN